MTTIDTMVVARLTQLVCDRSQSADMAARKGYIITTVEAVIVTDYRLRIVSSNDNLVAAIAV